MKRIGRPPLYKIRDATCETCGVYFKWKQTKWHTTRRFCTGNCHMKWERERRRKVPENYGLLYRLYVKDNLTQVQMAKIFNTSHRVVAKRLAQLGIKIRKATRQKICRVKGCTKPIKLVWNATNHCWYGRMCAYHRKLHYAELNRKRQRRLKRLNPILWRYETEALTQCSQEEKWLIEARKQLQEVKQRLRGLSR